MTASTAISPATLAAPVAPVENVPSVDDLKNAIASASNASVQSGYATATLRSIVLARYTYTVTSRRYAREVRGSLYLPESHRADVVRLMWLDATGSTNPPKSADRSAGEKSFAQYVARFGTVAVDLDYGLDALADEETADAAYDLITADRAAQKAREARAAMLLWVSGLPADDKKAFDRVLNVLSLATKGEDADTHRAAFLVECKPLTND
jgi:hypothetical protein